MTALKLHKDERITLLRGVRLFSSCTKDELRKIASLMEQLEVGQTRILSEQGKVGAEFFVIVEGVATATRNGMQLAVLRPGDFFGELALLDGGPRTATVVADTDMHLLVFSRRDFSRLHSLAPTVAYKMLAELGARLRRADSMFDGKSSSDLTSIQSI
jgi:CRP/FNR family transcriptional regulator, cyclic AMP receptor protein